jgi:ABC-type transport system involved in multi-copper enzyme maturation permease subunit
MIRLVQLEYLKLKSNRAMWILLGLYFVAIAAVAIGAGSFLDYLTEQGADYRGINPSIFPIYDWEDIWHNLAYLAYFFAVFPAFLLIISVSNEFSYKTHRQNIIDGLSRTEFFLSKLSFAAFLALVSAVFLFLLGFILAVVESTQTTWSAFVYTLEFIPAHALQLFIFFLFSIFLVLLIRRSGVTIVLLLLYAVILEPILAALIDYKLPELGAVLPLDSVSSIVRIPFSKYLLMHTQNYIALADLLRAGFWGVVFTLLIFWILRKRDF